MTRAVSHVPRALLEQLLAAIEIGRVDCPLAKLDLIEMGLGSVANALAETLAGLDAAATKAALGLVLAERRHRVPPRLDLVWSGPDVRDSVSRDTAIVLRELFDGAERSVIIGGYSFDDPSLLEPLHRRMKSAGIAVTLFVNISSEARTPEEGTALATKTIDRFFHEMWAFGPPRPDVYYDPRTAMRGPPWVSLHAKCVVVDDARALVTSANFTERGQERNIEVGVLIDDAGFASELSAQWRLLVAAGAMRRYGG